MIKLVLLVGLGAVIFLGAAYLRLESLHDASLRYAEAARDLCYAQRGYDPRYLGSVPQPIVAECTHPMADYMAAENGRYFSAGLFGAFIAALLVGATGLVLRRRKQGQPPAA